ncbi:class I SAM-dependent methyltransferase [Mycolicibacterium helvum]|uniref:Methyltransferase n=1 Tax=Mycolicibacterium helvum TaxID=1534349 RepID=A0A7I7TDB0_9MYCO|nr:class I SAM-dependent methyltransferase [Mycolicibacterium helvum]BBY66743.1 methyltransferase [Mycolicibacterium helvum]
MRGIAILDSANLDQFHAWDGANGIFWSDRADRFDQGMAAYHPELLNAAGIHDDSAVLDIGCGAGQVTRDAARIAHRGSALGVDLSSPLLELATTRAAAEALSNVSFVQADAQVYDFGESRFDTAVSRHGTMFFGIPTKAFSNIARALRPAGRLVQLVWQPLDRNEGIRTFRTISAGGRDLPVPSPSSPNPFSLSDPIRVRQILGDVGFVDIEMTALHAPMFYGRDVDDAFDFIAAQSASAFAELDDRSRRRALETLRANISDHLTDEGVFYDAAHWLIQAQRR